MILMSKKNKIPAVKICTFIKTITMKRIINTMALLAFCFLMMQLNASAQKTVVKPVAKAKPAVTNTKIKNNVQLKTVGFKISEAYLVFDDGTPVPADNKVELNQNVNLLLIIDGGWKVKDSLVYPGASEKIALNTGYLVLKEDDLFASYDATGVSATDARYITLKAVITELDDKKKFIIVSFKVWDKKSTSNVSGSYKLFIK
jgi:hypothetical protein